MIASALILALTLAGAPAAPPVARATPRAVLSVVDRRVGCNHWAGEEAYDRERAREIARVFRQLRCRALDRDEARLKRRYAGRADVLRLLKRADQSDGELAPE